MSNVANIVNPSNLPPEQLKAAERRALKDGIKAGLPTLPGIAAWALVVGVAMVKSDFTLWQALGMTFLVFAGSAQLAALPMIVLDTPAWIIFLTSLIVNLRFVIFSVILAPHFRHLHWRKRLFWSYLSGDVPIVLFSQRFPSPEPEVGKYQFLKGLIVPNWFSWQIGAVIGIVLGSKIPDAWGVGYAGTLAVLCIVLPLLANRAALIGAIGAGATALVAKDWPLKLGTLFAIVVGMACALMWTEWRSRRERKDAS